MALLDDVKLALRISPTIIAYDDEVQDLIEAAKADLKLSGVDPAKLDESDPLIKRAIVTYCKAHFGLTTRTPSAWSGPMTCSRRT